MVVYFTDKGKPFLGVFEKARDITEVLEGTPNPSDSYMMLPRAYSDV